MWLLFCHQSDLMRTFPTLCKDCILQKFWLSWDPIISMLWGASVLTTNFIVEMVHVYDVKLERSDSTDDFFFLTRMLQSTLSGRCSSSVSLRCCWHRPSFTTGPVCVSDNNQQSLLKPSLCWQQVAWEQDSNGIQAVSKDSQSSVTDRPGSKYLFFADVVVTEVFFPFNKDNIW